MLKNNKNILNMIILSSCNAFTPLSNSSASALADSKDGQPIGWARHAARHLTDLACEEEAPSILLLAVLGQLLQVKELADGHSPAGEDDFVHCIGLLRSYLLS